jgi:hypothetical protein
MTSIKVPDGMTSIGASAFQSCTSLASIDIPDSVTSIGNSAFSSCTSLASIDLPDNLTSIGDIAFYSCTSLASIDIPDSVTNIGGGAFQNCSRLASITCRATTPPTIYSNTFGNVPATANIYVPAESVEAYKAKNYWSVRADYIQAIPSEG